MDNLRAVFPEQDENYLAKVFAYCGNNVEVAAEFIFSGEDLPEEDSSENEKKGKEEEKKKSRDSELDLVLNENLKKAINRDLFSDVELVSTEGSKVFAHEVILASRSPYLSAFLQSVTPNKGNRKILEVAISHKMLLYLLEYLYTDYIDFPESEAHDLLSVADMMIIPELRKRCELGIQKYSKNSLGEDLIKTLNSPDFSPDITLVIDGSKILCHKLILSAGCDFFHAMFSGMMAESQKNEIVIPEISGELFKILLKVIYSNGNNINEYLTEENTLDLFLLSNQYIVPTLQRACENLIKDSLDVENVCQVLEMTGNLSPALKFVCLNFVYLYYDQVVKTEGFLNNPKLKKDIEQRYEEFKNETLSNFMNQITDDDLEVIKEHMRNEIAKFLKKQVENTFIDETLSAEAETPVGTIIYKVSNLILAPMSNRRLVKQRDIRVEPSKNTLEIGIFVQNISLQMEHVKWEYKQKNFPNLEDYGETDVILEGVRMDIVFRVMPTGKGTPQLSLKEFVFEVNDFRLELYSGKYSWMYKLFLDLFQNKIKGKIEQQFGLKMREELAHLTRSLNAMGMTEDFQ